MHVDLGARRKNIFLVVKLSGGGGGFKPPEPIKVKNGRQTKKKMSGGGGIRTLVVRPLNNIFVCVFPALYVQYNVRTYRRYLARQYSAL